MAVSFNREKDELWQKKEQLEAELSTFREKPGERWITDTEVDRCTKCKELFSITRRKVCKHFIVTARMTI